MKKILVILGVIILSLVMTFTASEFLSLYHFGDKITFTTFTYLLFMFCFITYILLSISYIVSKRIRKEKIGIKKISCILLFFAALILLLCFVVLLNFDWLTYYSNFNSSPFYVFILVRGIEFLVPMVILVVIGIILLKNENK